MAFTAAPLLGVNGKGGTAVLLNSAKITGTGALAPFSLPYPSGVYFGQLMIQCVLGTVTTLVADLEFDMTGTDANFTAIVTGTDYFATAVAGPYNYVGGNARYRLNVTSFTDGGATGAFFWAMCG